jgi:hypothetical protein
MLEVERLESRENPGDTLHIWAGMVTPVKMPVLIEQRARFLPIPTPKADLVLISASNDGRPSRYLDKAHDVFPKSRNVGNVYSVDAEIDSVWNKKQVPITVIIVATETPGGHGVVIGRDYLFAESDATRLMNAEAGKVKSILFLVDAADQKAKVYQEIATGLASVSVVTVSGYTGAIRISSGPPAELLITAHSELTTWTGAPPGRGK